MKPAGSDAQEALGTSRFTKAQPQPSQGLAVVKPFWASVSSQHRGVDQMASTAIAILCCRKSMSCIGSILYLATATAINSFPTTNGSRSFQAAKGDKVWVPLTVKQ